MSSSPTPHWPDALHNHKSLTFSQLVVHEYILRTIGHPGGVPVGPSEGKDFTKIYRSTFEATATATTGSTNSLAASVKITKDLFETARYTLKKLAEDESYSGIFDTDTGTTSVSDDDPNRQYLQKVLTKAFPKQSTGKYTGGGAPAVELLKPSFHVGIVGAGVAGLYTAMILKTLNIDYEILEASDRIGGRVYTHRFSNDPGDYYDPGAMRFPDTPIMDRTFILFKQLGIEKVRPGGRFKAKHGDLIPYHLTGPNTPVFFNGVLVTPPHPSNGNVVETRPDPHFYGTGYGGVVPDRYAQKSPNVVMDLVLGPWRDKFAKDPDATVKKLFDMDLKAVTVRQEIFKRLAKTENPPTRSQSYHISHWAETLNASTCRYDGAFIETFIHSVDFSYPFLPPKPQRRRRGERPAPPPAPKTTEWWCLNGGTDVLTQEMTVNVGAHNITKNARVTSIRKHHGESLRPMRVRLEGNPTERRYSHVITTSTTPCLQAMDLSEAGLRTDQKEALRVLKYEPAVKLGIKFAKKWWIKLGITAGGVGKTDRPTRVVVYPSYALDDDPEEPGVLLACYNASTDALRLGALSRGKDPTNQTLILNLVLRDLALMHELPFKSLRDLVVAHHFHDWGQNEFSVGAWGDFAPGQFANFFGCLQVPAADGKLFFAGELTSIYHGWIVAALNSAHRAVYMMLLQEGKYELLSRMKQVWGALPELDQTSVCMLVALTGRTETYRPEKKEDLYKESDMYVPDTTGETDSYPPWTAKQVESGYAGGEPFMKDRGSLGRGAGGDSRERSDMYVPDVRSRSERSDMYVPDVRGPERSDMYVPDVGGSEQGSEGSDEDESAFYEHSDMYVPDVYFPGPG